MARAFRKVTQKDIARKAGVSQVSVSLALRNDPSLPQATKERILKIVEDMGYRPDPMLQSLTAYRIQNQEHQFQGTLAWVTNHDDPQGWNEGDLYPAYFRGASQQAEKLGYKLEPFWLADPDLSSKRASSILYSRNIQGLIINPSPANQSELQLDWNQFSVVSLGYTTVKPKFHLVAPRHFGGVTQCFEKLQSYGYQRIG
ncbi:MAG: LacI family DNA-binding transcriptional regulator, partial [Verrucomicrobiota bacterium]